MNTSADAADQVVRMSLNGAEVALRVSGAGAKNAAILLTKAFKSTLNETNRTKGAIRLINLTRSGKKLDVTEVADSDLKTFCKEAKKYGILYTVLKNREDSAGKTEIMYKSEDKEKLNRIFKKLGMTTVDMAEVKDAITPDLNGQKPPERTAQKSDPDKFIDELMRKPNPTQEKSQTENPTQARTEKSNRSEPSSSNKSKASKQSYPDNVGKRKSVKKELADIKKDMEKRANGAKQTKNKVLEHEVSKKAKRVR